jgi:hypothetical protein
MGGERRIRTAQKRQLLPQALSRNNFKALDSI